MNINKIIEGLGTRGFTGLDQICNMGQCHKDNEHFVLVTDGLVIYSSVPQWHKPHHDKVVKHWKHHHDGDDYNNHSDHAPFSFDELDKVIKKK